MKNFRQIGRLLALIAVLFFCQDLLAQVKPAPPTVRKSADYIRIRWADEFRYSVADSDTLQILAGNVELNQDTIFLFCDSATILNSTYMVAKGSFILQQGDSTTIFADSAEYSSLTKIAELFSDVSMLKGRQKLFTDRLTYNTETKIATYLTGATMTDDTTFLTSRRGYFHGQTDDIYFGDSVVVVNPDFTLRSDTMRFNAASKIVTFLAPTLIVQDKARIYTEDGFYDINNKFAEFTKNPQYLKNDQRAWAKVMRYDGEKKEVTLIGDAHFLDSTTYATADRIRYNSQTEVTVLEGNAFIKDEKRTIRGATIVYDAKNGTYATRGRSQIVDGDQTLDADEVDYDKERELGIARGNVIWRDTSENLTVVCEFAEHAKERNFLKASGGRNGRPLLIRVIDGDSLYIAADTLVSMRPEDAEALQAAQDTLTTTADSLAQDMLKVMADSLAQDTLPTEKPAAPTDDVSADTLTQAPLPQPEAPTEDADEKTAAGTGPPDHLTELPERPEPPALQDLPLPEPIVPEALFEMPPSPDAPAMDTAGLTERMLADSLLPPLQDLAADTALTGVLTELPDTLATEEAEKEPRLILAYHDVRIFKSDLQATCDSLSYSTLDSMFRLYRLPIIWSDSSQFTADTVFIQLANDKIDRIFLRINAFIANTPDEVFFNQIKGKYSTAFFEEGELRNVRVEGNAESVYYALDDEDAYIGVNKTICSEMLIHFGNNEVEGIRFYAQPTATLFPMKKADHEGLKMEGFHWQEEKRPKSVDDLFTARQGFTPILSPDPAPDEAAEPTEPAPSRPESERPRELLPLRPSAGKE